MARTSFKRADVLLLAVLCISFLATAQGVDHRQARVRVINKSGRNIEGGSMYVAHKYNDRDNDVYRNQLAFRKDLRDGETDDADGRNVVDYNTDDSNRGKNYWYVNFVFSDKRAIHQSVPSNRRCAMDILEAAGPVAISAASSAIEGVAKCGFPPVRGCAAPNAVAAGAAVAGGAIARDILNNDHKSCSFRQHNLRSEDSTENDGWVTITIHKDNRITCDSPSGEGEGKYEMIEVMPDGSIKVDTMGMRFSGIADKNRRQARVRVVNKSGRDIEAGSTFVAHKYNNDVQYRNQLAFSKRLRDGEIDDADGKNVVDYNTDDSNRGKNYWYVNFVFSDKRAIHQSVPDSRRCAMNILEAAGPVAISAASSAIEGVAKCGFPPVRGCAAPNAVAAGAAVAGGAIAREILSNDHKSCSFRQHNLRSEDSTENDGWVTITIHKDNRITCDSPSGEVEDKYEMIEVMPDGSIKVDTMGMRFSGIADKNRRQARVRVVNKSGRDIEAGSTFVAHKFNDDVQYRNQLAFSKRLRDGEIDDADGKNVVDYNTDDSNRGKNYWYVNFVFSDKRAIHQSVPDSRRCAMNILEAAGPVAISAASAAIEGVAKCGFPPVRGCAAPNAVAAGAAVAGGAIARDILSNDHKSCSFRQHNLRSEDSTENDGWVTITIHKDNRITCDSPSGEGEGKYEMIEVLPDGRIKVDTKSMRFWGTADNNRRQARVRVINKSGRDIEAGSMFVAHKYSDVYKNMLFFSDVYKNQLAFRKGLRDGETDDAQGRNVVDYRTDDSRRGRNLWYVTFVFSDKRAIYQSEPKDFQCAMDVLEAAGPAALSAASDAIDGVAKCGFPPVRGCAAPNAVAAGAAVAAGTISKEVLNNEKTCGFKQYALRSKDSTENDGWVSITIENDDQITFESPSGNDKTRYQMMQVMPDGQIKVDDTKNYLINAFKDLQNVLFME